MRLGSKGNAMSWKRLLAKCFLEKSMLQLNCKKRGDASPRSLWNAKAINVGTVRSQFALNRCRHLADPDID
jgi:hypothetical protein